MAESKVNQIDGIPFWGHGTKENLEAGITPNKTQNEQEAVEETIEEVATSDDGDEEETETEPSSE